MKPIAIFVDEHPRLDLAAFSIRHQNSKADLSVGSGFLSVNQDVIDSSPFDVHSSETRYEKVKSAVRDLLRYGGYKPTGRGKPASEYLVKAVREEKLGTINPTVDTLNAVSLHSGLPISVVDVAKCTGVADGLRVGIAPADSSYVFNASGQTIKLDGLLCLFDSEGPCANAVKDSQRTKTDEATQDSLVIIWGTNELPEYSAATEVWFRDLVQQNAIGETGDVILK